MYQSNLFIQSCLESAFDFLEISSTAVPYYNGFLQLWYVTNQCFENSWEIVIKINKKSEVTLPILSSEIYVIS